MKIIDYIKNIVIILAIIILSISVRDNLSHISKLEIEVDNLKENLYQTNQIMIKLQKELEQSNHHSIIETLSKSSLSKPDFVPSLSIDVKRISPAPSS